MKILGIVSETHDAGLALIADGIPALVIEEERLNREKHTIDFPALALAEVFGERHGHRLEEIAAITTPWNLHRLRWELVKAIAGGLPSSLDLIKTEASPTQHRDIVFLNHYLRKGLRKRFGSRLPKIVNVGHHDAHAAIYFVSPFEEASVLVMDGSATTRRRALTPAWATSSSDTGTGSSGTVSASSIRSSRITSDSGRSRRER